MRKSALVSAFASRRRSWFFGPVWTMGSLSDSQANGDRQPPPAEAEDAGAQGEEEDTGEKMEGVASIALLPSGAISGHFIRLPDSVCYGLHGTRTFLSSLTFIVLVYRLTSNFLMRALYPWLQLLIT